MKLKNRLYRVGSVIAIAAMLIAMAPMPQPASPSPSLDLPTDLFFSEYVEGTSLNKAVEIYNGTGAPIDLAAGNYQVDVYFNGSTSAGTTIDLSGVIAAGDVFVVADDGADPAILSVTNQTTTSSLWNGDDAVVLSKDGVLLDVIGQIGFDPGSEWGSGDITTKEHTLRRKADVSVGDTDGSDAFDPSVEWNGFPQNTFDGLGCLSDTCTEPTPTPPPADFVSIHDIQYAEDSSGDSPYEGQTVTTSGVVTAFFYAGGDRYTYIQDGTGPWSGLLVADPDAYVDVGDLLEVHGSVSEYYDVTEMYQPDAVVLSSGNPLPDPEALDSVDVSQEQWESVLVRVEDVSVTNPDLGHGEWQVDDGTGGLVVDDLGDYAYTPAQDDFLPYVQGPLYYSFGAYKLEPRDDTDIGAPAPPPEACGDPFTPIYTVQGDGAASPLVGTEVAVEGVVVGDFQNNGSADNGDLNGFYVQDPVGDADPTTSDGVFIYAPGGQDVSLGDAVRVRGNVSEFGGLTEIGANEIWLCSTGNSVSPTTLGLPVTSVEDFEAYEGMLVTFPQALVISEYYNFDRYNEIVLTSTRHLTPTAKFEPGSPEEAQAVQDYLHDSIILDDGRTTQNPDPAIHPDGAAFTLTNRFRGGDTVTGATGVMEDSHGYYRIQPTHGATYSSENPRPASPAPVGGDIKVASFNVLNYFTTLDTDGNQCGPPGYEQDCRGANTTEELTRQRTKILAALEGINADVFGLIEIQNDMGASVMDLVDHLNADLGADTYAYIDTGYIGTDAIKLAIIYKPATVTPIGSYAVLDSTVDPRFVDTKNRPALAQSFMPNGSGRLFTLTVNHLKSKGSSCDDIFDPDTGDGSGNCNGTRTLAAQALVDWLATDPTEVGSPNYLIMGDLNSYDKEDPIDAIKTGSDDTLGTGDDFNDLVFQFQGEDAYSYVFDGQIGYLDSALAGSNIRAGVTGTTIWHINADEPDILDYDETYKAPAQDALFEPNAYRSSDHDPVIVGLSSSEIAASSPEQIGVLLQYFADNGQITGNNTAKALLDHLDKAARFKANGQVAAYRAQLQAFINQVQGKTPQFVTQEAADALIAEATALLGG